MLTPTWSTMPMLNRPGQMTWSSIRHSLRVRRWGRNGVMGGGGACELMGKDWCQAHRKQPPEAGQEQRPDSDHSSAGLPSGENILWWVLGYGCVLSLGPHGNADMWVIFSPLATPAQVQEADELLL
uniref:Uncharacterized protein n=1 Tax=Molossus molossus TaxID=27622 RepID=A0A7J8EEB1_MOLMO|nr:hypothetical protein HJG59_008889 [Molossus molossus]